MAILAGYQPIAKMSIAGRNENQATVNAQGSKRTIRDGRRRA